MAMWTVSAAPGAVTPYQVEAAFRAWHCQTHARAPSWQAEERSVRVLRGGRVL